MVIKGWPNTNKEILQKRKKKGYNNLVENVIFCIIVQNITKNVFDKMKDTQG